MNFEKPSFNKEVPKPIDEEIYKKYSSVEINIANLRKPEPHSEQKQLFMDGQIDCPKFSYEEIKTTDFETPDNQLLELKKELKDGLSKNSEINQAYIWKINEKIARIRMMKELKLLQETSNPEHVKRYQRYIEFIYGKPDKDIFFDIAKVLDQRLKQIPFESLDEEHQQAYTVMENCIQNTFQNLNSNKNFDEIRPDNEKERGEAITDIETIKEYFDNAVEKLGLNNEWKVVVSEKARSTMAVLEKSQKIILPSQDSLDNRPKNRAFTPEMVQGLIVHEIHTHVLRKQNAKEGRFKLLEIGLDRNKEGEEGLATYREQQETGATDFAGLDNYLTAGLAYGLDSGESRNFGEVFEIMKSYYQVFDTNISSEKAKELAWGRSLRLFRGTPGNIPGLVNLKDIVYRKGNIATYELMKKDYSKKIDFNIGKYDPTNPRHLNILVKLGILDIDLEALNS